LFFSFSVTTGLPCPGFSGQLYKQENVYWMLVCTTVVRANSLNNNCSYFSDLGGGGRFAPPQIILLDFFSPFQPNFELGQLKHKSFGNFYFSLCQKSFLIMFSPCTMNQKNLKKIRLRLEPATLRSGPILTNFARDTRKHSTPLVPTLDSFQIDKNRDWKGSNCA
jgi:hypothetical protein